MGFFGRLFGGTDYEQRKIKIQEHEAQAPSQEALDRRKRSVVFLKQNGVPTTDNLPVIEDTGSVKIRPPKEIAQRLVSCTICAVGGETGDRALVRRLLVDFQAEDLLSPNEKAFIETKIDVQQDRLQFSWQYERSWVLLWALGYIEKLEYPPKICEVPKLVDLIKGRSIAQIVREANPRSRREILDEADLIYRLHWAVVEQRVNGKIEVPREVEKGVVQERHAALNWLIGYMGQTWDDISTDT